MSEITINSKGTLSTTAQTLLNDVASAESNITSSASSLGSVADIDGINLAAAGKTLMSNFDSIFTDFSNISQTASNYINNLMSFDIDDFSGATSTSPTGADSMTTLTGNGTVTYTAGEMLEGGMSMPLYYQDDYGDIPLGETSDMAEGGCGFASCSMVLSYLTGKTITPREFVDDWSNSYFIDGDGMAWSLPAAAAEHYGVGSVEETTDIDKVVEALKNNQPVMSSQDPGTFCLGRGHIIALRGVTEDGQILVNDPDARSSENNYMAFSPYEVDENACNYWIFDTKK